MEQVYKGYAIFDAMTQTDFFFCTDAKKRSAGMLKAAAECTQVAPRYEAGNSGAI